MKLLSKVLNNSPKKLEALKLESILIEITQLSSKTFIQSFYFMYLNLFRQIDYDNDPLWVAKEFFNRINNFSFIEVINDVINREGRGDEYAGCEFPEEIDSNKESFEGVKCWFVEDEQIVSENDFKSCLKLTCKEYAKLNTEKKLEILQILEKTI